jgi:arylsulfatase A-like enzyme
MKALTCRLAVLLLSPAAAFAADRAVPARPNVIVILADDLGYGDVQCYNPQRGKIPTPNLNRLAAQGLRFTDAHSSSGVCSPSRFALLTGRYHWRTQLQSGIVGVFGPPLIAPDRLTIAGLARQQGYRTACIGKWHLGWDWPVDKAQRKLIQFARPAGASDEGPVATPELRAAWRRLFTQAIPGGPTTRGFDTYFGTDVPNWPPYCFIENDRTIGVPSEFLPASQLRNNLASLPGPALPDWKLNEILPALGDRAVQFVTASAARPEPFLLYLPLTAPHTPIAVNEPWRGRSGLIPYGDFVMETDALVGRVLEAVERSGTTERTLVVFTSDNGCAPYIGAPEMEAKGHFPSGPWRGYKGDAWEGGHRVPFLVRWPGVVRPGRVCGQLAHHADLLATLAAIWGARLPDNAGEDSFSLLALLQGGDQPARPHAVSCAASGVPAVRLGSWKLIAGAASGPFAKGRDGNGTKLYDLANDPAETHDLAPEQPARVAEMRSLLDKLITDGRSTPGTIQRNDVEVRRFPLAAVEPPAAKTRQAKK